VTPRKTKRKIQTSAPNEDNPVRRAQKRIHQLICGNPPGDSNRSIAAEYAISRDILGNYVTLDIPHRNHIREALQRIREYLDDPTRSRPLNILLIAESGFGKSYFVNALANSIDELENSYVSFNLANLEGINDLAPTVEVLRNIKADDKIPVLFLDEIDARPDLMPRLLPILWDGELHIGGRDLKLGKTVIVLAGTDPALLAALDDPRARTRAAVDSPPKTVDFLSRLNGGHIRIPDLELIDDNEDCPRDRRLDKVCIGISLLQARFGEQLEQVPWALLRFIVDTRFRFAVRSLSHLVFSIASQKPQVRHLRINDLKLPFGKADLLRDHSLMQHLQDFSPYDVVKRWREFAKTKELIRVAKPDSESRPG